MGSTRQEATALRIENRTWPASLTASQLVRFTKPGSEVDLCARWYLKAAYRVPFLCQPVVLERS
jgi:hypothetical protein